MSTALAGRVALVTGSSRGIGRGIAEELAAGGAAVAVHYASRASAADEVVAALEASGARACAVGGDVRDPDAIGAALAAAADELGPIDILVNNAAVHYGGRVQELSLTAWDDVIRTSIDGAFFCTRAVVPSMVARGWGRVVMISSPVALKGFPGDGAYGAAKAGQLGMMRSLALELARTGVTVNAVLPGFVETEMTGDLDDRAREGIIRALPMRRPVLPREVGAAVAFLCSPAAASVTGVTLPADGGLSA